LKEGMGRVVNEIGIEEALYMVRHPVGYG